MARATHPAKDAERRLTSSLLPETERERERQRQHVRQRRPAEVAEQHPEQHPKVPDHALEALEGALAAAEPPTNRRRGAPRALPQIGSREREAQVGAVRLGLEWTAFTRKLEAAEHRARDAEAECARLRAEGESRSRASTLDEDDDDVDELERQLDTVGENERLTKELAAARARIAELERQLDRRTVENWPRERRGTRSPADARAPIELEITTPPPPPPPSSPLSSQS